MDKQNFRKMLLSRKVPENRIASAIELAERFDTFMTGRSSSAETAWDFSKSLIQEGNNSEENYITLARYCLFNKNQEMYVAFLELIDGGEVGENLYKKIKDHFGEAFLEDVFRGAQVPPLGIPTPEKPAFMLPVIERLERKIGKQACADLLSDSLRDLPEEYYLPEREEFIRRGDIDSFLAWRKEAFVARLEDCLRENKPFFSQEITREVIAYVQSEPEMGGGLRNGNIIYETKIPYMTIRFLAETDPVMKRYYYCHCPWVREAIKNGDRYDAKTFCHCSGGYHKKPFEVVFGQPLKVEVLESAWKGDQRCRFAIHLPEEAASGKSGSFINNA